MKNQNKKYTILAGGIVVLLIGALSTMAYILGDAILPSSCTGYLYMYPKLLIGYLGVAFIVILVYYIRKLKEKIHSKGAK